MRGGLLTLAGGAALICAVLLVGPSIGFYGRADREAGALFGLVVASIGLYRCIRAKNQGRFFSVVAALILVGAGIAIYVVPRAQKTAQRESQDDLLKAVSRGDVDDVQRALQNGANPDASASPLTTPLILASYNGQLEIAKLLLHAKGNPNISTRSGGTPLIAAVLNDDVEMVRLLLEFGADPRARSSDGSALEFAEDNPKIQALLESKRL